MVNGIGNPKHVQTRLTRPVRRQHRARWPPDSSGQRAITRPPFMPAPMRRMHQSIAKMATLGITNALLAATNVLRQLTRGGQTRTSPFGCVGFGFALASETAKCTQGVAQFHKLRIHVSNLWLTPCSTEKPQIYTPTRLWHR